MKETRLSPFYLASYLFIGGIGFLAFPKTILSLFLSNGDYSDLMLRMIGSFMLGIGIIVVQIIRHRATDMYSTTLILRGMFLTLFTSFYFAYRDPMLLVLLIVVGIGWVLTFISHISDSRREIEVGTP